MCILYSKKSKKETSMVWSSSSSPPMKGFALYKKSVSFLISLYQTLAGSYRNYWWGGGGGNRVS